MTKYNVGVREVFVSTREVWASSEEEAISFVRDGASEEIMCEYSHTLDTDFWTIEKVEES